MDRRSDTLTSSRVAPDLEASTVRTAQPVNGMAAGVLTRDRSRWGPVWAGFISTASLFVLMEMFVIWVGWVTVTAGPGGVVGTGREWVTWIVAVIAFFIGGLVAALTTPVRGIVATALDGFLVWGLTTVFIMAGSIAGAGLLFGAFGNTIARILVVTPGSTIPAHSVGAFANDAQTAAFWAFITLITTAAAAVLGGWCGNLSNPIGYFTTGTDRIA